MRKILMATAVAVSAFGSANAAIPIKLGVLNDQSGVLVDSGGKGSVVAAQMAIDEFDAKSHDLNVTVISADHQNKADIGLNVARKWYDVDGVDVILDVPISSIALAISNLTREKGKILITSTGGSSELTGSKCSPNTFNWTYDTWSLAHNMGSSMTKRGGKSWFFITVDYTFGEQLEKDATDAIVKEGGKVVGKLKTPFLATDMSSFLLQAQASNADVIGLTNGTDQTAQSIKQSWEFGIPGSKQSLAAFIMAITDVKALGAKTAQGLYLSSPFYWDLNDRTRAFSERFAKRFDGKKPTMFQAGVYSATMHYLKAVAAAGTKDSKQVIAKMKELPTNDDVFGEGQVLENGRKIHDLYLFQIKSPSESKSPWDLYKRVAVTPAAQAFQSAKASGCEYVK
ncbi:MAG: ABC transporter substrate-binding protein [Burkholderiaceae bacterium]